MKKRNRKKNTIVKILKGGLCASGWIATIIMGIGLHKRTEEKREAKNKVLRLKSLIHLFRRELRPALEDDTDWRSGWKTEGMTSVEIYNEVLRDYCEEEHQI